MQIEKLRAHQYPASTTPHVGSGIRMTGGTLKIVEWGGGGKPDRVAEWYDAEDRTAPGCLAARMPAAARLSLLIARPAAGAPHHSHDNWIPDRSTSIRYSPVVAVM